MPRLGLKVEDVGLKILSWADALWIGQVGLEIEEDGAQIGVDNPHTNNKIGNKMKK